MNVSSISQSINGGSICLNNKSLRKEKQNIAFCSAKTGFVTKSEFTKNTGLYSKLALAFTSLGALLYRAIFYKRVKEMERRELMNTEIEKMSAEIKNAYEAEDGNFDSFKEKTDKMYKFIEENTTNNYYAGYATKVIEFLQDRYKLSQESGNRDSLFVPFTDDKGDYTPRYEKFMKLFKEVAIEAVTYDHFSKHNTERNWYFFEKDTAIAHRIMNNPIGGLSNEELNGDTYPGKIRSFTQEEPDLFGGILRLKAETLEYEIGDMLAEIKNAYEAENGDFDSFKEKTDKMRKFIKENVSNSEVAEFVEKTIEFLEERYKLSQERGDKAIRFALFMNVEGNYDSKYNEFMEGLKELAIKSVI